VTQHESANIRSAQMRLIRSKDTQIELALRRALHRLGYRYRLHARDLPGTPDLVFPKLRKVLFIHGCFWHRHTGCVKARTPKSNLDYWTLKFARNIERDKQSQAALNSTGWQYLIIWECEFRRIDEAAEKVVAFLKSMNHG